MGRKKTYRHKVETMHPPIKWPKIMQRTGWWTGVCFVAPIYISGVMGIQGKVKDFRNGQISSRPHTSFWAPKWWWKVGEMWPLDLKRAIYRWRWSIVPFGQINDIYIYIYGHHPPRSTYLIFNGMTICIYVFLFCDYFGVRLTRYAVGHMYSMYRCIRSRAGPEILYVAFSEKVSCCRAVLVGTG